LCWDRPDTIGIEDLPRRIFDKPDSANLPATYDDAVKDAKRHIVLSALAQAKENSRSPPKRWHSTLTTSPRSFARSISKPQPEVAGRTLEKLTYAD
jgi:hypothetical protein